MPIGRPSMIFPSQADGKGLSVFVYPLYLFDLHDIFCLLTM